jgi:hypothetical protein
MSPSEKPAPLPDSDNGEAKRPAVVFHLWTDRVTNVEVAVWPNEVQVDGKLQIRHSCTISRTYRKDVDGEQQKWIKNGSFRSHDLAALCFLLERAHAWMLAQRLEQCNSG